MRPTRQPMHTAGAYSHARPLQPYDGRSIQPQGSGLRGCACGGLHDDLLASGQSVWLQGNLYSQSRVPNLCSTRATASTISSG